MSLQNIIIPQMGESIHEVTLIKLYKKVGDKVKVGDVLADLATDKVDTELLSTANGVIQDIFFSKEKATIPVGGAFATVLPEGMRPVSTPSTIPPEAITHKPTFSATTSPPPITQPQVLPSPPPVLTTNITPMELPNSIGYLSPVVCSLIFENRISSEELVYIQGSGSENRITKKNLLLYLKEQRQQVLKRLASPKQQPLDATSPAAPVALATEPTTQPDYAYIGKTEPKYNPIEGETVSSVSRMRLTIAKNLKQSKDTNVHVTSFAEIDVSNLVQWRERNKNTFEQKFGQKLTYTPLIVEALIQTIKAFPMINNLLRGEMVIERQNINIGIATALPDGNLIVPILKKTQDLSLLALTTSINTLVQRARNNELDFSDIDGGTFTLTNIGTFHSLMGTPIIPPNQSAILATGVIQKKPVVHNTPFGEAIIARHMMFISLSYDHRIIDGIVGGGFLSHFGKLIEGFNSNRSLLF